VIIFVRNLSHMNDLPDNLFHFGFDTPYQPCKQTAIDTESDKFKSLLDLCGGMSKIKTINYRHSSYGLKHIAEKHLGTYISNGEIIAAMILSGFTYKCERGPNAHFNVSEKSVSAISPPKNTFRLTKIKRRFL
jgi:hypothetical protein